MASEIYELRVEGATNTERQENVMHFVGGNLTADDTLTNGEFLIDAWHTNILPLYLALLPTQYSALSLSARRATPKPSAVANKEYEYATQGGTGGSGLMANQICPCINLVPAIGFKTLGKIFLPAVYDGGILDNQFDAGWITAMDALMAAMVANFGTSGKTWQLAVFSRKLATYALVTAWHASARIGFQKKRRAPV